MTQQKIEIDVIINDLVFPPFDNDKIDMVRNFIANVGDINLSRVSNR
jgi:hypothetical protein